jgi:DNA-binding NarL/FixJ family response regulator
MWLGSRLLASAAARCPPLRASAQHHRETTALAERSSTRREVVVSTQLGYRLAGTVTSPSPQPPSVASVQPARVAIVEDDVVLGQALASAVRASDGLKLQGVAETLAAGRALVQTGVDVLLVDLALPDGSGLSLIDFAHRQFGCKVLVISVLGDVRNVVTAIEYGASGYLLKGADTLQVSTALRTVLSGGAPISPGVAGHILSRIRGAPRASDQKLGLKLTAKEVVILEHLAKGLSFKEVAHAEQISPHTVGDHVKAIYRKLAVNSRGEAVFEAVKAGLIRLED